MNRRSRSAAMLVVAATVLGVLGFVPASPAWATGPDVRRPATALGTHRRVVDQPGQGAVAPQPRPAPIPPQVLQHNFGPSYPFGYNYAYRGPSYPFGRNYGTPPTRQAFAPRVAPRWVPGYWAQQWVPQYYTYEVWIPGYYAADGAWVQGYYDTQATDAGYYQQVWVDGYWTD